MGFPIVHPSRAPRGDGLLHHHPAHRHRRIPLIDYTAVCLCLIVCPLVIFKDPSRHLRSWRSCASSARARTAPNGRMDSVSHGSGGIDPPPEYRSSYSRLPILLSPAPSKHQLQEYRSTVLQVLEAAGLRPLVEGMCTRDLLAYRSPDLDAIYPELVASADGSITAADVEKRRQARALQMHKS